MSRKLIVAIDGPAGAGKSTVAKALASRLSLPHVDTGAIYRALTLKALRTGVPLVEGDRLAKLAEDSDIHVEGDRVFLDGNDVSAEIRTAPVTVSVSVVASHPSVRSRLTQLQRSLAEEGGVVEGRDIGTVVFPEADLKVFLTAEPGERALRRSADLESEGKRPELERVVEQIHARDLADFERAASPLRVAEGALVIDSTGREVDDIVEEIVRAIDLSHPPRTASATDESSRRVPNVVAVIGRPNVGKSTLVNRLAGHRGSIVGRAPGLTRDRVSAEAQWRGRTFQILDTGGLPKEALGDRPSGDLAPKVAAQALLAAKEADLILLLVDGTTGITADELALTRQLRRVEVPVVLVANKVDDESQEAAVTELWSLGLGEAIPVSALHGRGTAELLDRIVDLLPKERDERRVEDVPSIAIVGRPNVGKSSLFNQIIGSERAIVHHEPGTTRDSIDTVASLSGRDYRFVDTAGLRRRTKRAGSEIYGAARTRKAILRSDLAVLVLDASEGATAQDQRIAEDVAEAGVGAIVSLNKWDKLSGAEGAEGAELSVAERLRFVSYAPVVRTSALTGRGVKKLLEQIVPVLAARQTRVPTATLNALVDEAQQLEPVPRAQNRPVRVLYATQVSVAPPTFVLFATDRVAASWLRFLERRLRERFGFVGNPIRLVVRQRRRRPREGQRLTRG